MRQVSVKTEVKYYYEDYVDGDTVAFTITFMNDTFDSCTYPSLGVLTFSGWQFMGRVRDVITELNCIHKQGEK